MTWRSGSQHTAGFDSVGWGNLCTRANFYSSEWTKGSFVPLIEQM